MVSAKGLTGKNLAQVVSDTDAACLATQINKLTENYSEVQAIGRVAGCGNLVRFLQLGADRRTGRCQ